VRIVTIAAPFRLTFIYARAYFGRSRRLGAAPRQAIPSRRPNRKSYLHTLAALLRGPRHEIRFAINGHAALEAASDFHPHLVLLDMGLPDMDGCETARRLKQLAGFVARIVAVTARAGDEDRRRSLAAGCMLHLIKPVEMRVMEKVVALAACGI
jgi:CheY-like chemotaxis protein